MALKTITGTLTRSDGTPVAQALVNVQLSAQAVITGTQEIAPNPLPAKTGADGTWSIAVHANLDLTPTTTYYTFSLAGSALASVPAAPFTLWLDANIDATREAVTVGAFASPVCSSVTRAQKGTSAHAHDPALAFADAMVYADWSAGPAAYPATQAVTVNLPRSFTTINRYQPSLGGSVQSSGAGSSFALSVGADIQILELVA